MGVEAPCAGVHRPIHPGELDEPPEGDGADGVERLPMLMTEKERSKADAELFDLDPGQLGGQEVARLVDHDNPGEDQDDQNADQNWIQAGRLLRWMLTSGRHSRT